MYRRPLHLVNITLYTTPSPRHQSTPRPQQQRRLLQPLPPPWLAVGGGLATTAAGLPAAKPPLWERSDDGTPPQPHLVVSSYDGATPWGVSQWYVFLVGIAGNINIMVLVLKYSSIGSAADGRVLRDALARPMD
nr:hypothetical protein [Tanacetum cinerariifolium]